MRTPSIGRRVVRTGVGMVAALALGFDLLVYFSLRSSLLMGLHRVLDGRVAAVREAADDAGPAALPSRLAELGLAVEIRDSAGHVVPPSRPGPRPVREGDETVSREVALPGGLTARVFASSADAQGKLRRLVTLELVATPLVVGLAAVILAWIAELALAPLDRVAAAARRTAGGQRGERLRPDRPETRLGQMAVAYDDMLDALETAVAEARRAEALSERLHERFRRIIETANEAFVATDATGAIIEWNAKAEQIFGWTRAEMLGRRLADTVVPPELREDHLQWLANVLAHGTDNSHRRPTLPALDRHGRRLTVEPAAWVTTHDGQPSLNQLFHDVSERSVWALCSAGSWRSGARRDRCRPTTSSAV